jgi:hypothetical protein
MQLYYMESIDSQHVFTDLNERGFFYTYLVKEV